MYYSERLNSITHLIGAVLALMGWGALLTIGWQADSIKVFIAYALFGFTLVILYSFSTLYHSFKTPQIKAILQKLDHIAIYLLIAGTYTPFTLVTLYNSSGVWLFSLVWLLAIVGISLEVLLKKRRESLHVFLYLLMGWLIVIDFDTLQQTLPEQGLRWLVTGGLAYTLGVIFYLLDHLNKLQHAHGIWHLFVLLGSLSHFIAVIGYVR